MGSASVPSAAVVPTLPDATTPVPSGPDDAGAVDAEADVELRSLDRGFSCSRNRHCGTTADEICCAPNATTLGRAFHDNGDNACEKPEECDAGAIVECDSQYDCVVRGKPNAVCCVHYVPTDGGSDAGLVDAGADADAGPGVPILTGVTCVPASECAAPKEILCDRRVSDGCPAGMQCVPHPASSSLSRCQ